MKTPERKDVWNAVEDYPSEIYSLWHHDTSRSAILRRLVEHFTPGCVAADFGCGAGYWLDNLSAAKKIYAVDFSKRLLAEAQKNAPHHCETRQQDLSGPLPGRIDFALCLNALMPESHSDCLLKLSRMRDALSTGGKLILVIFSQECASSYINLKHFSAAQDGREEASLEEVLSWYLGWQNNPLGYTKHRNGTVVKFWCKDEAEAVFQMVGGLRPLECFRVPREWEGRLVGGFEPWFWGWVLEKVE
jgi:SAM-dependent methyltransferase